MKLDLAKKGMLTSIYGVLLCAFVGIVYEDLRHDPSTTAQHWKDIMLWLMALGATILLIGASIAYSTRLRRPKSQ